MVLCNMLEYDDFKIEIQKFRKMTINGIEMQPQS